MQLGDRSVPIRATAIGKQYKYGQIVPFNHTYDLYKFEPYTITDDFEVNTYERCACAFVRARARVCVCESSFQFIPMYILIHTKVPNSQ